MAAAANEASTALFVPDGERFVPTPLCRGPWSPDAQHGGPPAALLGRAAERFEDGDRMHVARLTVELIRPVPLAPLTVSLSFARPGKKVQLVAASLCAGEVEVAHALALRIRRRDLPPPADVPPDPSPPPDPESGTFQQPPWGDGIVRPAFHSDAVDHRFVAGSFERPGPAVDWIRLRVPLVAGEVTSPLSRVAAAADFGNGISWVLSRLDGWQFINPDLTVYLHRPAEGEWVCLDAVTRVGSQGVGLSESLLRDRRGIIGRSLQSLLLDRT
jgi:Acyl-CoA thioesterase C-terminal domain/Acyl-CoA thioesterase N-terminal domain